MVAYNFQSQFAPYIESGAKSQTIRADRKRHARPGEPVQLYTGLRTRSCRKLRNPDPICTHNLLVELSLHGRMPAAFVSGLLVPDMDAFAQADGFDDAAHMFTWFQETHGLPFIGRLIKWQP